MEQDNNTKDCAEYFRKHKGFDRLLVLIRKKIESLGKTAGTVKLDHLSEEEKLALSGLFGKTVIEDTITIKLSSLENELSATRFVGVTLKGVLEEYFNEEIISNSDKMKRKSELKLSIRESIQNLVLGEFGQLNRLSVMLSAMSENEFNKLIQTCIRKIDHKDSDNKIHIIDTVYNTLLPIGKAVETIDALEGSTIRLAVLAMNCTGDPHAFDRSRTSGRLLIKALHTGKMIDSIEQKNIISAEEILELYISCGIRPDDISSFTTLYGIRLYIGNKPHNAYDSFIANHELYLVSLSNLSSVTKAVPVNKSVYIVENQMVFSELCKFCPGASIICTSGQLKTASILIIDLLCKEDCTLYYNGDFDSEGLIIADKLVQRNDKKIKLWHMTTHDYEKTVSSVQLNEERLKKLKHIKNEQLLETADIIIETKNAGYQENLVNDLISDILR